MLVAVFWAGEEVEVDSEQADKGEQAKAKEWIPFHCVSILKVKKSEDKG